MASSFHSWNDCCARKLGRYDVSIDEFDDSRTADRSGRAAGNL
jgi:hypothetical protein